MHMCTLGCPCGGSNPTCLAGWGEGCGGVWVGDCLQKGSGEAGSRIKGQCLGPRSFDCGVGEWPLITTDRGILSVCAGDV